MRFLKLVLAASLVGVNANPHVADVKLLGWNIATVGACQNSGAAVKGLRTKAGGAAADHLTQRECAAACAETAACVGYQHGEYCTIFGTTASKDDSGVGSGWTPVNGGAAATITGSDGSTATDLCVTPCGASHTTLTTVFPACVVGARYHAVGTGGCRGNGGPNDRVNHIGGTGFATRASCETRCDVDSDCVGYVYQTASPNNCQIYGPNIAGTCNKGSHYNPTDCTGHGTCSPPAGSKTFGANGDSAATATHQDLFDCRATGDSAACTRLGSAGLTKNSAWGAFYANWVSMEKYCGVCGLSDLRAGGHDRATCESAGEFTWTPWTWTADAGTWTANTKHDGVGLDTDVEYWMTSHIHINSPTDGITCYELDNEDHENQCHGTDSHGAHGGLATKTDSECKATFDTALAAAAANDPASAACPSGCTFVAKPVMTRNIVPHPADQFSGHPSRRGWKEGVAGACRQKQGRGSNAMRAAAGKYCNKACFDPADADPVYGGPTQAACWQACQDEGLGCIAYHHGAYCTLGGPVYETVNTPASGVPYATDAGVVRAAWVTSQAAHGDNSTSWSGATSHGWAEGDWVGQDGLGRWTPETVVDGTKPNVEYMCFVRWGDAEWLAATHKAEYVAGLGSASAANSLAFRRKVQDVVAASVVTAFYPGGIPPEQVTVAISNGRMTVSVKAPDQELETQLKTALDAGIMASASALQTALRAGPTGLTVTVDSLPAPAAAGATSGTTPGATPGTAVADPCFPGDATVVRETGAAARLDELKSGDKIRAADASGALYYDEVSRFSYADYAKEAAFVVLSTAKSLLRLTAEHRVPVGESCCSNLKKAKDVAVGETVWLSAAGAAKPAVVTKVGSATGVGVHNPLMKHGGFPLVDGVVTAFESIGVVKLASLTVPLAEALCEATGTCAAVHELFALVNGLSPRPFIGGVVGGAGLGLVVASGLAAAAAAAGIRRASKATSL